MKIILTIVGEEDAPVLVRMLDGAESADTVIEALDEIASEQGRSVKSILLED